MEGFKIVSFSPEVIDLINRRRPGRKVGTPGHAGSRKTLKGAIAEKAAKALKANTFESVESAIEHFESEYLGKAGKLTKDQRRHFKMKIESFL
jgi:hypothetical protein